MIARRGAQRLGVSRRQVVAICLVLMGWSAAQPAAATAAESWQAQVVDVDATGLSQPASEVSLKVVTLQAGQGDQPPKQVGVQAVTASPRGVVSFAPPRSGQQLQLRFLEKGAEVNAPVTATGQVVGRYAKKLTSKDVTLRVRANLEVRDSGLRAWLLYTFRTTATGSVTWGDKDAITLPLLAPVIGDVVLDRGSVPSAARHIETTVEGDAKIQRRGGALMVTGTLAPGRPISVRVRYPIGIAKATVALGMRGVVGETHLAVAAIGVRPSRPRVYASLPARGGRNDEGRDRMAGLALVQPIGQGEMARVWVTDLPANATLPRRLLASAALLLALIAFAAIIRRRS